MIGMPARGTRSWQLRRGARAGSQCQQHKGPGSARPWHQTGKRGATGGAVVCAARAAVTARSTGRQSMSAAQGTRISPPVAPDWKAWCRAARLFALPVLQLRRGARAGSRCHLCRCSGSARPWHQTGKRGAGRRGCLRCPCLELRRGARAGSQCQQHKGPGSARPWHQTGKRGATGGAAVCVARAS